MAADVTVIEVDNAEKLQRHELLAGLAPTGRWFTCDKERFLVIAAFLQLSDSHIIPILSDKRMFTEKSLFDRIMPIDITLTKAPS